MSRNGENASSSDGKEMEFQNNFEMVSKNTFKCAVPRITKGLRSYLEQEQFFGGNNEFPTMTWSFSLREIWETDPSSEVVQFFYRCKVYEGHPPPMYQVRVSALGTSNNRDCGFDGSPYHDKELYKSGLRNNTYGSFDLGKHPSPLSGIPTIDNVLVLEVTVELYRLVETGNEEVNSVHAWNMQNEGAAKTHLLELLKTGHLSDVKIRSCDGQEFHAHKLLLKSNKNDKFFIHVENDKRYIVEPKYIHWHIRVDLNSRIP